MMAQPARPWQVIQPPLPHAVLHGASPLHPLQVQLLAHRGLTEPDDLRRWFAADPALIADPALLPDMERAVGRLRTAIAAGELIGIVGDCDVDGLTATAIMAETLSLLGAREPLCLIAPRDAAGRGLTAAAVARLRAATVGLCLTVDNGSSSVAEVAELRTAGIDTIISDHHHLPPVAPEAFAIVNPQRTDARYPNRAISGAGIALQMARALVGEQDLATPHIAGLVELAGLGTLADVVDLAPENHVLVRRALHHMQTHPRPAIQALCELTNMTSAALTPRDLAFMVAPRLNAAGRLSDPLVALRLLRSRDLAEARDLARQLEALNTERQRRTELMVAEALVQAVAQAAQGEPIIFVEGDGWPLGLVGIVAGRLSDRFNRLAVVVAIQGATCRASLRSPRGFHIAEALEGIHPPLAQAGGHAQAGGFGAPIAQMPAIRAHLSQAYRAAQQVRLTEPDPPLLVDAVLPLNRITPDYVALLRDLAPFGAGFAEPIFVTEGVVLQRAWAVGDRHRKVLVTARGDRRLFFWRDGLRFPPPPLGVPMDVAWRYDLAPYGDEVEAQLVAIFPRQ